MIHGGRLIFDENRFDEAAEKELVKLMLGRMTLPFTTGELPTRALSPSLARALLPPPPPASLANLTRSAHLAFCTVSLTSWNAETDEAQLKLAKTVMQNDQLHRAVKDIFKKMSGAMTTRIMRDAILSEIPGFTVTETQILLNAASLVNTDYQKLQPVVRRLRFCPPSHPIHRAIALSCDSSPVR